MSTSSGSPSTAETRASSRPELFVTGCVGSGLAARKAVLCPLRGAVVGGIVGGYLADKPGRHTGTNPEPLRPLLARLKKLSSKEPRHPVVLAAGVVLLLVVGAFLLDGRPYVALAVSLAGGLLIEQVVRRKFPDREQKP
jgi:hypothetical protein